MREPFGDPGILVNAAGVNLRRPLLEIGGDPETLLGRCHDLLAAGGVALVEVDADDEVDHRVSLTLHCSDGRVSSPVPWARLGSRPLMRLAARRGFVAVEEWRVDGRVFIALRKIV